MTTASPSVRHRLGVLGAITILPMFIGGLVLALLYGLAEQRSTDRQLLSISQDVSIAVDRHLESALATLRTLALALPQDHAGLATFHAQATKATTLYPGSAIALRTASGQHLVNTFVPWGAPLPRSEDPVLLAADAKALETNGPVISDLYVGATAKRPFVVVNFPVEFSGEKHLLNLALPTEYLLRLLTAPSLASREWLKVLVDNNHRVIARSRSHDSFVGKRAGSDFIENTRGESGTFTSTTLDNIDVVDGYVRSPLTGWVTLTAVPEAEYSAPLRSSALLVIIIAASGFLISLLVSRLYARRFTSAIAKLAIAASGLASRKEASFKPTGIKELDDVSYAIANASNELFRQDQSNRLLIDELNHRVKNSLATVQSLAQQTLKRSGSFEDFEKVFSGRLRALARSHDALSEAGWLNVELAGLVDQVCRVITSDRLVAAGPEIALSARAALALGLVFYELSTNAVKYGALTKESGHIDFKWSIESTRDDPQVLHMKWVEAGSFERREAKGGGFGLRFIQRSIEWELSGRLTTRLDDNGFCFEAWIPSAVWRGGGQRLSIN